MLTSDKPREKMEELLMLCSKCGKIVTDDTKFCSNCGEKSEILNENEVENIILTPTENVVTKKTPIKKKIIFIAMAAIVIVGLVITYFIINPPISGSEVPYDLEWGSTNEQVQKVDKLATGLREDQLIKEGSFATSFMSCKDFGIRGNTSVGVYYYFGQDDSLNKIEISVGTDIDGKVQNYNTIKGKIEKYYNAVCKVSATKSNPKYGDDEILTWSTGKNVIRIGDDIGNKESVVITITP
jgi:RNA polymerase subunit RPABC4/transcription elongation factor Spt4